MLKSPMWSGDENKGPEEWERWRQGLLALAGMKNLYSYTREGFEERAKTLKNIRNIRSRLSGSGSCQLGAQEVPQPL